MKYIYEEKFYPKELFLLFFLLFLAVAGVVVWHFLNTGLGSSDILLRLGVYALVWSTISLLGAYFIHISIRVSASEIEVGRPRLKFVIPRREVKGCHLDRTPFLRYLRSAPRLADFYLPEKGAWRCAFAIWTKPRLVLELKAGSEAKPIMKSPLGRKLNKTPKERFVEIAFPTNHPEKIMALLKSRR
jgi:hypothetical protein